jgi:hypothetical protein
MRARYLGPVGGDNPVSPVELFTRESPFGTVWLARTLAGVLRTRGHPGLDSKKEYDCRSYDGRVMGQAGFVGTSLVHPNGSTRP